MGSADKEGVLYRRTRHSRLLVGIVVVLAVSAASCNPLGEDWKLDQLGLDYEHQGSTIQIEPEEEFSVRLRANGMFPETPWQIRAMDTALIELIDEGHDTEARAPGDYQGGEGSSKPWGFIGGTGFGFVGRAEGVSQLVFDMQADGQLVDVYELTVAVVDDACDVNEGAVGIVTPIRCERKPPKGGPVGLVYDDYGWAVWLEPGDEFTVELRANGLHPDMAWRVAEIDTAVVNLQWSVHDTDVQASAEHSRWPPTIFPETRFRFVGSALGESLLVLEMRAGGERIDVYELTVFVVADACDIGPGPIFHVCD
jgi:hypothetical protein